MKLRKIFYVNEKNRRILENLLTFLSITFFVLGTFLFVLGYRNVDMGYNLIWLKLQNVINPTTVIYDQYLWLDGGVKDEDLYSYGLGQMFISYFLFLVSFVFLIWTALFRKKER